MPDPLDLPVGLTIGLPTMRIQNGDDAPVEVTAVVEDQPVPPVPVNEDSSNG